MDDAQVARFTALWAQAQPSVYAFISAAVTSFHDAEDVLQKVATASVSKFGDYDSSRPFVAWTIGIARWEILRHLREGSTDRHQFVSDSLEQVANAFEAIASELDDRRRALADCLKLVQGRSRTVLEKRYGDGLKTGAIAEDLKLTRTNVSVILHRTYSQLRDCINRKITAGDVS